MIFLYGDEWPGYSGILGNSFGMTVAHSRIGPKVYVQDRILEGDNEVCSLLNDGGILYVCGDAEYMAPGVYAVLVDILAPPKSISKSEAIKLVKRLKAADRYQEDI